MSAQNDGLQRWQNTNIDVLKHQKAVCLLVAGLSIDDTAKELNISVRTLERWFKHPEFNQNLALAIKHVYVSCFAKAVGYVDESMNVLMGIIRDENTLTRHRIDAVKLLFEFTAKGYQEIFKSQNEDQISEVTKKQVRILNEGLLLNEAAQRYPKHVAEAIMDKNARTVWADLYPGVPYPENDGRLQIPPEVQEVINGFILARQMEAGNETESELEGNS